MATKKRSEQLTYRQGDVGIIPVASIPTDAKPGTREGGRIILAHGEATGHAHAITDPDVAVFVGNDGRVFLRVPEAGTKVTHEEHTAIRLPGGTYEVTRQQEWQDEESRNVQD